jgi:hypothetical protein
MCTALGTEARSSSFSLVLTSHEVGVMPGSESGMMSREGDRTLERRLDDGLGLITELNSSRSSIH